MLFFLPLAADVGAGFVEAFGEAAFLFLEEGV